jgi:Leucine-rich repeat (LRR) protein
LTNNQLSVLPEEICNLINLKYLWLQNNKLKSLPAKILKMPFGCIAVDLLIFLI